MMEQEGRPTSHYLLHLNYLLYMLYPALSCLGLFVCLLKFNVDEILYKLLNLSSEP